MSDLDKDFESIVTQINAKLKEAAKALEEANKLRKKANLPSLIFTQWLSDDIGYNKKLSATQVADRITKLREQLESIDVSELESQLDQAGWSTSSSYC